MLDPPDDLEEMVAEMWRKGLSPEDGGDMLLSLYSAEDLAVRLVAMDPDGWVTEEDEKRFGG
jgi:hypothetical protein